MKNRYRRKGLAWCVTLENSYDQEIKKSAEISAIGLIPEPSVSKAIIAAITIIDTTNKVGGKKGVEITGIIGAPGFLVTPKGYGPYDILVEVGDEVSKLGDHWAGIVRGNIERAGDWLGSHEPGPAIAQALGISRRKKKNKSGAIVADRQQALDWEKFTFLALPNGKIAIQGHTGYLAAEPDGGTYANRDKIQNWEKWDIIHNSDGTVSLKSHHGYYFVSIDGGGSVCGADRSEIGSWEKFYLEYDNAGRVSMKTYEKRLYVSAQP